MLINFCVCDTACENFELNIEGGPVLSWLVHVSSSSFKGTFRLLRFVWSNAMIFAVLKERLIYHRYTVL